MGNHTYKIFARTSIELFEKYISLILDFDSSIIDIWSHDISTAYTDLGSIKFQ